MRPALLRPISTARAAEENPPQGAVSASAQGFWLRSQFWRFQIVGWLLLAGASLPMKLAAYQPVGAALALALTREPLGLLLSSGLRLIYRRAYARNVGYLAMGALIFFASSVAGLIDMWLGRMISGPFGTAEERLFSAAMFSFRSMIYIAWSLLYFWFKAQRAAQERELNLARAETIRREAELQLLRTQVHPHFLFNALNTILATLEPAQERPQRVVAGLAGYLRYALSHRHDAMVPLGAEYDAALHYLAVEQERFRGELLADCAIEPAARDVAVRGVLIQPLIENAVKYSRETSEPPYRVRLRVTRPAPDAVAIEVANTGTWIEPSHAAGPHGTGLENLQRRLVLLYPERHTLSATAADGWVTVKLRIADGASQGGPAEAPAAPRFEVALANPGSKS
jgi:hypothetical protein